MVYKLRLLTQHIMFVILVYGGRMGIHLGYSLPCFSCPYISGCAGSCYLMTLQGSWRGLQMSLAHMTSAMGLEALSFLGLFIFLAVLLNKFWCGWVCPFGLIQDWFTWVRKKLGIRESQLSWTARDRLKPVKYVLLAYLLILPPLIAHAGLHPDFSLPFCNICPGKPLLPLFVGETRYLALDFTNTITFVFTILSVTVAGAMLAGMFFKERFFCIFCPMLVLIHIFRKISPVRYEKNVEGCLGCGNCQRMCPMEIRDVHEQKTDKDVLSEDCTLCLTCTESCPAQEVLQVKFFKWRLFSSSRDYVSRNFPQGNIRHD